MLNIARAIKDGNYQLNQDGTYTVYGVVNIQTYDTATEEDVKAKRAYFVGACINHRTEQYKVAATLSTLNPTVKNWDIIRTPGGRLEVQNIRRDGSGECELHPLDGQHLGPLHTGEDWTYGNIYQLPSDSYTVAVSATQTSKVWERNA
jgi:hypothetical protein